VAFLNSLSEHDRNHPNAGTNRATADDNGFATRRRIARSLDGATASINARCLSHERRSRRRDRRKLKPVFGYLHRNHEKIGENTTYLGSMPYTDRLDYFCSMTNNWAYALSVEKLAGIEVPERAQYLRVILAELTRLQNHASLLGFLLSDMGAWGTPLMYAFREREKILDLFESLAGSRMMCDYMRFGGCRVDASDEWLARAKQIVDRFPKFLDEFEELILGNEIVIGRTQNVGKLSAELAINAGITGPMLRACGVNYDIRKVDGYGFYPRFKFRIPLGQHGDTYDRLMMRALEMRESVGILKQAFRASSGRANHESESEDPCLSAAGWRSLWAHRSTQGRCSASI
jgi:NADH-quinone oxidoreductase subunit D